MTSVTLEALTSFEEKNVKEWFERFDALCVLLKVNDGEKVSALISHLGSSAYRILSESFAPKSVAEKTYADIKQCMLGHQSTDTLIAVARYQFSRIRQKENEMVHGLYNRLNSAAIACKFDKKDVRIKDQLVASLSHVDQIQIVLQIKNDEYVAMSSKELMQKVQAIETVKHGLHMMTEKESTKFDISAVESKRPTQDYKCFQCGGHHERKKCPAYNRTCNFCKKKGHFSNMCRAKRNMEKPKQTYGKNRRRIGRFAHNYVSDEEKSVSSVLAVYNKSATNRFQIPIEVNGQTVNFFLDTGAQVSVIKKDVAERLGLKLQSPQKQLHSYDGNQLDVIGSARVKIKWKGLENEVNLFVINSKSPHDGLLGNDILNVFQKNVKIFNIGNEEGIKSIFVDIGLKESACPVFLKSRPIPIGLKDKVKNEIHRLLRKNVIERIPYF